jgi:hypothetical protein
LKSDRLYHYNIKIIFCGYSKSLSVEIMKNGWRPAECQVYDLTCLINWTRSLGIPHPLTYNGGYIATYQVPDMALDRMPSATIGINPIKMPIISVTIL